MKLKSCLFLALVATIDVSAATTKCGNGAYSGNIAPDIVNSKLTLKTQEFCFSSFTVMHSGISRTPLWSAEHLTRAGLSSKSERTDDFHSEDRLPSSQRSELNDYAHSGYDRGHLAPSADMPNEKSQHESFSLANMIPQAPDNNRGVWANIERSTRDLTSVYGDIYVVTGVIFAGSNVQRIGGRVMVPTKIYKAIYIPSIGQGAAYLVENTNDSGYRVINIANLETMSGVRLFQKMSAAAKRSPMDLPVPAAGHHKKTNYGILGINQAKLSDFSKKITEKAGTPVECGAKKYCSEMSNCAEAKFYLSSCMVSSLDRDGDGTPCEKLCK